MDRTERSRSADRGGKELFTLDVGYRNLMEDVVLQYVDNMMKMDGGCTCAVCRSDVIAYALNHLPPKYVVSDTGRMMVKLDSYASQFRADVTAILSDAIRQVRKNPRHN